MGGSTESQGRLGKGVQNVGACVFSALLRKSDFVAWIFTRKFHTATLLSPSENHTIPKLVSSIGFMLNVGQLKLFIKQQFESRLNATVN